jgi:cell division protein FtsW
MVFCVFFFPKDITKLLYVGSFFFALILICLLAYVLVYGTAIQGSTRWIRLPFISFQPSSLAHPILIILFSKAFTQKHTIINKTGFFAFIREFKVQVALTMTVIILIFLQFHLSTLIVLICTLLSMIFVANFKRSMIMVLLLILIGSFLIILSIGANYRSNRMEIYSKYSLFHKIVGADRQTITADDYQVRESLTAISQGGFFGVGRAGGRAKHKYLPDINSDYIFAIIGEEFGFFGGMLIIIAFSVLLFRIFMISSSAVLLFDRYLVMGMGMNIFITSIVNIGVSLSALPSTGLPLPFISYGGSALAANIGMIAIILNISKKRGVISEVQTNNY